MLSFDFHAIMGQTLKKEIFLKGDSKKKRRVQCFSNISSSSSLFNHQNQIVFFDSSQQKITSSSFCCCSFSFSSSPIFILYPNFLNRIEFFFCSMQQEQEEETKIFLHLVDVDTFELIGAWLLDVFIKEPFITKKYELCLPLNQKIQKKISYQNSWHQKQKLLLRSSEKHLMQPFVSLQQEQKQEQQDKDKVCFVSIPSGEQIFLRLIFFPVSYPMTKKIYLFLNDVLNEKEEEQNEECLVFETTWI
jgi:hypothetical protein